MPENTPDPKPPLPYEELADVIDLSLLTGQLLLQHGADSARIEATVHHIGTGLGCNWLDILVSPNAILITTTSGDQFRTKLRRVTRLGVNMAMIVTINDLSRRVYSGELDRFTLRQALEAAIDADPEYDRWTVVVMVGLACGAFSKLFGGDWVVFIMTVIASGTAMFVRQELAHRYFNQYIMVTVTAFVATVVAGLALMLNLSENPTIALSASVLLLVPGVPLINAAEDIIQGHALIGVVRGVIGGLISVSIALGIIMAITLLRIEGI